MTDPLAYLTAKSNGLEEEAQEILEVAGLTEEDLPHLPTPKGTGVLPPPVITPGFEHNWPSVGVTESFFDRALTAAAGMDSNGMPVETQANGIDGVDGLDEWAGEEGADGVPAAEEAEDAWDIAPDEAQAEEAAADEVVAGEAEAEEEDGEVQPGISESELWTRNSPLAADHVAAGSFETAMQLLNRQVGAVHFAPLKPLFISTYQAARIYLPASASLPPLEVHLRRSPDDVEPRSLLPSASRSLASINATELKTAYAQFRKAEFSEAAATFRTILQSLLLVVASSEAEAKEVRAPVPRIFCRLLTFDILADCRPRRFVPRVSHRAVVGDRTAQIGSSGAGQPQAPARARGLLHALRSAARPPRSRFAAGDDDLQQGQELPHRRRLREAVTGPQPCRERRSLCEYLVPDPCALHC